jgi:hypothetical protein
MKKIILAAAIFFLLICPVVNAQTQQAYSNPLKKAFIKYEKVSWQTYDFFVLSEPENLPDLEIEWIVDAKETYNSPKVRYFFASGEHQVKVKVSDKYGNIQYDSVKLKIDFWSLQNNLFWWAFYIFLVLLILYYWITKILYLLYRNKISKQARLFLSFLDEDGWVEKIIKNKLKV